MTSSIHSQVGIIRFLLAAAFGLLAVVPRLSAQENTYAEKLGYKSDEIVLIMHVEDMGMSLAANKGVIDGVERGIANSVGVMPGPWVAHAAYYVKEHPGVDIGLQLTLNSEFDFCRWFSSGRFGGSIFDGSRWLFLAVRSIASHKCLT